MNRDRLKTIQDHCRKSANPEIAAHSQKYFKTAPGEYGYGDVFLGIRTPELKKITRLFDNTPISTVSALLKSRYHEERCVALAIWVRQFEEGTPEDKNNIYNAYLAHTRWINNWDLVDMSAYKIVGAHLLKQNSSVLYTLAQSSCLWERRIAIVSSLAFIRNNRFHETLTLAEYLLCDTEDLIHKAVGWMLREVGKRDMAILLAYLKTRCKYMPRTMLRYAIEKLDPPLRKKIMSGDL